MKKILGILLLFTGMVKAQPLIHQPANLVLMDTYNDNSEYYLIGNMAPQILGTLDPNAYTLVFYHDADFQNPLGDAYWNCTNETVYVKVTENAAPEHFATTSFQIILVPTPVIGLGQDLLQTDIPFDGTATFDLTTQTTAILNGLTGMNLVFYPSEADAQADTNAILTPASYNNTSNPQAIYAKVTNPATGGYSFSAFRIVVSSVETITIADDYFRSRVLHSFDYNHDDVIQLSEALSVTSLDLSNPDIWNQPVYDLSGIENFINIKDLFIGGNPLGDVDLSALTKLESLSMSSTNCTSLNVNGLTHLKSLIADTGQITSLDVSTCTSLESLIVPRQQLTSLNLGNLSGIISLYCNNNHLATLNLSALTHLVSLCCSDNAITSLDLTGLNDLVGLCYGNAAQSPVDISHLTHLQWLSYGGGLATALQLNTAPNLLSVWAWNSNLTELDLSGLPLVNIVRLFNNNDLTFVNMKNGGQFLFSDDFMAYKTEFQSNPNLFYVCTNEADQQAVNDKLSLETSNNGQAHAGTYCTFVPGGNFNTITGTIRFDSNNNGCDASDIVQPNVKVSINDGATIGSTFIENNGMYHFYTTEGSFNVNASLENPGWFNISPAMVTVPFANRDNHISMQDFCLTANGIHPDLEVVLTPKAIARPGFDAPYAITFKNKGNQVLSGQVTLSFDDARTDLVSAEPAVSSQLLNQLVWNYADLRPFESREINLVLNINSPMETPAVNSGDSLAFNVIVSPVSGDELPLDNQFECHQNVVNSFDPNAITCLEGPTATPDKIGDYLHYRVEFENTGTASAVNVVVKDVIDTDKFDISTLEVIGASAAQRTVVRGNVVEFIFENINLERNLYRLPPVGGHGDILFKIKTKSSLAVGDSVINSADIFFDYNFPIDTGNANTVFAALSQGVFVKDASITMYPNPASSKVNIAADSNISSVSLYDSQGRVVQTLSGNSKSIDISNQSKGVYFLKVNTEKGSVVEKVLKQ